MNKSEVKPEINYKLKIKFENGKKGFFDVFPYHVYEAFNDLRVIEVFKEVLSSGCFVEWDCGAYLSADAIEASLK